jgi:hypothetical protein
VSLIGYAFAEGARQGFGRSHAVYVPEFLPRGAVDRALGRVQLPQHLIWSQLDAAVSGHVPRR